LILNFLVLCFQSDHLLSDSFKLTEYAKQKLFGGA
jgi:hypothetical protein